MKTLEHKRAFALSYKQEKTLNVLKDGGQLFHFIDDNTFGLDDVDGNSLKFNRLTYWALRKRGLIEQKESPSMMVDIYGLTKFGLNIITDKS